MWYTSINNYESTAKKYFKIFVERLRQWGSRFHQNTLFSCQNVNQFQLVGTEFAECHMSIGHMLVWIRIGEIWKQTHTPTHTISHLTCKLQLYSSPMSLSPSSVGLIKIELMYCRQRVIAGFSIYVPFAFHFPTFDMAQWPCEYFEHVCVCVYAEKWLF